ncbi:MAG: hypothetical protein U0263_09350 [Polyangiaceae bacterium]
MRLRWLAICIGFSACAGSPAPEPKPAVAQAVVVPDAKEEHTETVAAPDRDTGAGVLGDCVITLRRAQELPAEGQERTTYDAALEAEQSGDFMTARKRYFELISQFPRSRLVPLAYLAFGELFAREAESDPTKRELAVQSYAEVLKYPPPENVVHAYASLRHGDMRRGSDDTQALASYKRARDAAGSPRRLRRRSGAAREDGMVDAYFGVGAPDRAFLFFRGATSEARARDMLRSLAQALRKAGKTADACAAGRGRGRTRSERRF